MDHQDELLKLACEMIWDEIEEGAYLVDRAGRIVHWNRMEALERAAHLDPLLRIPNRGYLEQQFMAQFDELRR